MSAQQVQLGDVGGYALTVSPVKTKAPVHYAGLSDGEVGGWGLSASPSHGAQRLRVP
jgi:hypothetical protein